MSDEDFDSEVDKEFTFMDVHTLREKVACIAQAAHEAVRALQAAKGGPVDPAWGDLPEELRADRIEAAAYVRDRRIYVLEDGTTGLTLALDKGTRGQAIRYKDGEYRPPADLVFCRTVETMLPVFAAELTPHERLERLATHDARDACGYAVDILYDALEQGSELAMRLVKTPNGMRLVGELPKT